LQKSNNYSFAHHPFLTFPFLPVIRMTLVTRHICPISIWFPLHRTE